MRIPRLAALAFVLVLMHVASAGAQRMHPALNRLCLADPNQTGVPCSDPYAGTNTVDRGSYARLMGQLSSVMAAPVLTPARTVGYRHFQVTIDHAFTSIERDSVYWRRAARGPDVDESSPDAASRFANGVDAADLDARLHLTRVAARKGLPLGFELGVGAAHLHRTNLWLWTFEVKWALFEGFRKRLPGFVPDLAVRATVTTATGTSGYSLLVPTADVILSKPFVVGRLVRVSPFIAGQMIWTIADSEVVDLTPGNLGDATWGVFPKIRAFHPRIAAGLELRIRALVLAGSYHHDLGDPGGGDIPSRQPRQWTASFSGGVVY